MERNLDELWAGDLERFPGMSKETFVRNRLADNLDALTELIAWAKRDKHLHGIEFDSKWNSYDRFVEETDEQGRTFSRVDSTKTHVAVRVGFEIVKPGHETGLFDSHTAITKCKKSYWCSHEGRDYLCADCRTDPTPEQELLAKFTQHLADGHSLLEDAEALDYQRGVQAAAAQREP